MNLTDPGFADVRPEAERLREALDEADECQNVLAACVRKAEAERDAARVDVAQLRRELASVDDALREAGIEYPLGARGVSDLGSLYEGMKENRDELRAEISRLMADGEKLAQTVQACPEGHHDANLAHARAERDELRAEVKRLRAE